MMFQAYQHYFNQKEGGIEEPQGNIQMRGNQARRGYRPLTTAGNSNGYRSGQTAEHSRTNSKNGIVNGLNKGASSTTS